MKKILFLFLMCAFIAIQATDVTLVVVADTHFDPPPESDQFHHVLAINKLEGNFVWKSKIDKKNTNFGGRNLTLNKIDAVVFAGDITDKADSNAFNLFKARYDMGNGEKQIHYPCYIGYGNHDVHPVIEEGQAKRNRVKMMWDYLKEKHFNSKSPVNAQNSDLKSMCYSWNIGKLHLIQLNNCFGDTTCNRSNYSEWLKNDLKKYASKNEPVIVFQHYGIDNWAIKWWPQNSLDQLAEIVKGYNVLSVVVGHTHAALILKHKNLKFIETNNAWDDSDGKASFNVLHITDDYFDVVNCKVLDDKGNFEIAKPFYSLKIKK